MAIAEALAAFAVASALAAWALGHVQAAELYLVIGVVVWLKHRENIGRLVAGTESKLGSKKKA